MGNHGRWNNNALDEQNRQGLRGTGSEVSTGASGISVDAYFGGGTSHHQQTRKDQATDYRILALAPSSSLLSINPTDETMLR